MLPRESSFISSIIRQPLIFNIVQKATVKAIGMAIIISMHWFIKTYTLFPNWRSVIKIHTSDITSKMLFFHPALPENPQINVAD